MREGKPRTVKIMAIDELAQKAAERTEQSDWFNGIDPRQWQKAGWFIGDMIGRDRWTIGRWVRAHGNELSAGTLCGIVQGSYNAPSGPTLGKLWELCRELADHDERTAQRICANYLALVGVIPPIKDIALNVELAQCEATLRKLTEKVKN